MRDVGGVVRVTRAKILEGQRRFAEMIENTYAIVSEQVLRQVVDQALDATRTLTMVENMGGKDDSELAMLSSQQFN